jgi:hypothetical protein
MNECEKGLAQFLIPRGNAPKLFEVMKEPFYLLASLLEVFLIVYGLSSIALGRYHGHHVLREELLANASTVLPLVHYRMCQRRLGRHLRQHRCKDRTLMTVPCGQDDRDAGPFIATAGMDFSGEAAPRTAQSLCRVPSVFFHAPAAC